MSTSPSRSPATSPGVKEAIDGAIAKASQSVRNLDWFEVVGIRGHIDGRQPSRTTR